MNKKCEIIFNDQVIENLNEHLHLKKGDVFYFSIRGTTPRSEEKYHTDPSTRIFPAHILQAVIDDINKKSHDHHIREFKVVKVTKSYQKDHHLSITNPEIIFYQSITVKETFRLRDIYYWIRHKLKK